MPVYSGIAPGVGASRQIDARRRRRPPANPASRGWSLPTKRGPETRRPGRAVAYICARPILHRRY
jgi:hypothetical protein